MVTSKNFNYIDFYFHDKVIRIYIDNPYSYNDIHEKALLKYNLLKRKEKLNKILNNI